MIRTHNDRDNLCSYNILVPPKLTQRWMNGWVGITLIIDSLVGQVMCGVLEQLTSSDGFLIPVNFRSLKGTVHHHHLRDWSVKKSTSCRGPTISVARERMEAEWLLRQVSSW